MNPQAIYEALVGLSVEEMIAVMDYAIRTRGDYDNGSVEMVQEFGASLLDFGIRYLTDED